MRRAHTLHLSTGTAGRHLLAVLLVAAAVVLGGWSPVGASTGSGHRPAAAREVSTAKTACPGGSAPGVTAKDIDVAVTVIDISGGSLSNTTFGLPSAAVQQSDWSLVAKHLNATGGVGCRQLDLHFYDINPVDSTAAQQACLNIAATHPYIVLDSGVLTETGVSNCLPEHKVPLASEYLTEEDLDQYHPYYLQIVGLPEEILTNGVLGMKQLKVFEPASGFKKLGVLYHTCSLDLLDAERKALAAAGVPSSKVDYYSLGCPTSGVDTAASMEQAVLNFKNAGVSDVMMLEITDGGVFTQVAAEQNYKPQYLYAEDDVATNVSSGADAPNPKNYNGAIDVLGSAYGEQSTPGLTPSGGTKSCNAIYRAASKPDVYAQTTGYSGLACDYLWFLQALLAHASSYSPSSFPKDMRAMGTVDYSYPLAPTDYSGAPSSATYGLSYWRAAYYHSSCRCWMVPDPAFRPPFST